MIVHVGGVIGSPSIKDLSNSIGLKWPTRFSKPVEFYGFKNSQGVKRLEGKGNSVRATHFTKRFILSIVCP